MPYWDPDHFLLDDTLNAQIWTRSPDLQRDIQPPETLTSIGSVGPQQAMLENHPNLGITPGDVLPWVPDIVGVDWLAPDSVMVFGVAWSAHFVSSAGLLESPLITNLLRRERESAVGDLRLDE